MILWLLSFMTSFSWSEDVIRLLSYSTVRATLSFFLSLFTGLTIAPYVINWLRNHKYEQVIKKMKSKDAIDLHAMHKSKHGTPTMGGVIIFISTLLPVFLFVRFPNTHVFLVLFIMIFSFILGLVDDLIKMKLKPGWGLTARVKFASQVVIALAIGIFLYLSPHTDATPMSIINPIIKNHAFVFGSIITYCLWIIFVIVGSTNAVNITDGLDGLAIGNCLIVEAGLIVLTYILGRSDWSSYLYLQYVPGSGEIFVFLWSLFGSCLAFLWYNSHPAEIFMGDSGALMLGGTLGTIAVLLHIELYFAIFCSIFIIETVSVILQVGSFKLRRKRIFKMAPIHHHFERCGWDETKIVIRFWIISIIMVVMGLGLLKLR